MEDNYARNVRYDVEQMLDILRAARAKSEESKLPSKWSEKMQDKAVTDKRKGRK